MGLPTDPYHSLNFAVVQSVIVVADREPVAPCAPGAVLGARGDLLELLGSVPDRRSGQGRDHLLAAMALGVASPARDQDSPADLAHHVRGQWAIESLHRLRDTLYQEDKSQVRTRSGPTTLRNLPSAPCAYPDAPMSPRPDGPAAP
jgi:hypothetical protein